MSHTPGPWTACNVGDYGDFDGQCRVVLGDDMRIAVVQGISQECQANARLIASAPDLLEALQRLVSVEQSDTVGIEWKKQLHDAVAKARAAMLRATGEQS